MGKKELKKQYQNLDINLIESISKLDKTKTKKITPFLLKMFNKSVLERNSWLDNVILELCTELLGHDNLENLYSFIEHLENNRIENSNFI